MEKQKRQDIIIKSCCLIAALVLWMYVRVNEDPVITSTVKYVPVKILNEDTLTERNLVLMSEQDFYINLTVKATASVIADLDKNKDFKLVADLQGYALTPGENKVQVTVKESPTGVSVVNAEGLLMKLDVDNLIEKNVDVKASVTGAVEQGYYNDENIISPNLVKVSGPERYVNKVSSITAEVDITGANVDITKNYKITCVDEDGKEVLGVTTYPEYVEITSKINKGKHLPINVVTSGSPTDSVSILSVEPSLKDIEIAGESEIINKITSIDTSPINLASIKENTSLDVNLIIPNGVYTVSGQKTVTVKITVKKYSEKTFKVPVEYTNLKAEYTASEGIKEVELTLKGEEAAINAINAATLKANVNLKDLVEGSHSLNVDVVGIPEGIEVKNQTPKTVDIELKTKSTQEESKADDN